MLVTIAHWLLAALDALVLVGAVIGQMGYATSEQRPQRQALACLALLPGRREEGPLAQVLLPGLRTSENTFLRPARGDFVSCAGLRAGIATPPTDMGAIETPGGKAVADTMSHPAKTLLAFGCYLLLLGLVLFFAPNILLGALGVQPTSEVWIRVVGMLVIIIGAYYGVASRYELRPLIAWSVPLRASVIVFFGGFVIAGVAPPILLLFGAVDLAAALWTWSALRVTLPLNSR
jgi:hypothetical protein